ncbi:MAG: AAA family ATPase [Candidatus Dojkabacteria bacterium]
MNDIELNEQFTTILDVLEHTDKSVFITGKAGTGKSTLLNYFRKHTRKPHAVIAPTGVAAINIEGETIHSFFGFKPGITPNEAVKVARSSWNKELYQNLALIVIDEISMVRADMMDSIDRFLQTVRKDRREFGGVQMAFIGDLFQLPPVVRSDEREIFTSEYTSPYFFDSHVIQNLLQGMEGLEIYELEKIYRQTDSTFIELLHAIRNRTVSPAQITLLNQQVRDAPTKNSEEPFIYLTATNQLADDINEAELENLHEKPKYYEGEIKGEFSERDLPTDELLGLKTGARVMFLNNDPEGRWINGTLGTVLEFVEEDDADAVVVMIDDGEEVVVTPNTWNNYESKFNREAKSIEKNEIGSFTQIPLKLAWAITIHKSQGKTFDNVVIDFGRGAFAHGQVYVALSRCRTLEGITLIKPVQARHIFMDARVVQFLNGTSLHESKKNQSEEDKLARLQAAIVNEQAVRIEYIKDGQSSIREIAPQRIEKMSYGGHDFMGIEAICLRRWDTRIFSLHKVLSVQPIEATGNVA